MAEIDEARWSSPTGSAPQRAGWAASFATHARRRQAEAQRRTAQAHRALAAAVRENERARNLTEQLAADVRRRYQRSRAGTLLPTGLGIVPATRRGLAYFDPGFVLTADPPAMLSALLDAALQLTSAQRGTAQLFDATVGGLRLTAQRGFERDFLKFFALVTDDHSACGAAMTNGRTVHVPDVAASSVFGTGPSRDVLLDAGVRAVRSIPLYYPDGDLLGLFSVHYGRVHHVGPAEDGLLSQLAASAARRLSRPSTRPSEGV